MEDILELILSILFLPFESQYDNLKIKINKIPNKGLRFLCKTLCVLIPFAFFFGLFSICSYVFRGYWF